MAKADRVALGLSVHTGWVAGVGVAGSLRAPRVLWREELELCGDAERFLFHRAADLAPAAAERAIAAATRDVGARATAEMARAIAALGGRAVVACAIVAGRAPTPGPLAHVLAAHPRIHLAEGCFYRDVLVAAAEANRLAVRVLGPRTLEAEAAQATRVPEAEVPTLLAAAGRAAGRPWARDQKLAALAAWVALAAQGGSTSS